MNGDSELDSQRALAFLGGDAALFTEVLQTFMSEAPQEYDAFIAALHARDRTATLKYLHRAAPTLAIIASEDLAGETRELYEAMLTSQDPVDGFLPRLTALGQRMDRLLAQTRDLLAQPSR